MCGGRCKVGGERGDTISYEESGRERGRESVEEGRLMALGAATS